MRRTKIFATISMVVVLVLACCALAACDPRGASIVEGNTDVVKAFNAVVPSGDVITQTALKAGEKYNVTVITDTYAAEYVVGKDFKIEGSTSIAGTAPSGTASAAADEQTQAPVPSALERAYAEALELAGITAEEVTGFDFDRDTYMGKAVYKVEIEEVGTKYEYIFDATDFTLLDSEIEFENDLPFGSYISEQKAYEFALKAAGAPAGSVEMKVVRSELEDGIKVFKVSFNFGAYRYDISIDALTGDVLKFSKNALKTEAPSFDENITSEDAKNVALSFIFPNGEAQTDFIVRKVKPDYEDGQFVYEVEIFAKSAEYEFEISAKDGAILDVEIDNVAAKTQPLPENRQFITRDEAIAAVKAVAGQDIYILEVEIDKEGGKYYYEIEARVNGAKLEYIVDALTGEVIGGGGSSPSDAVISEAEAVNKALQTFKLDANMIDRQYVKLELEDGVLCYTVKLYVGSTEYEAEIDATTGALRKQDIDREEEHLPPATGTATLTREQAIAALKQHLGEQANVFVDKVEYEYENGKYVYEIEVMIDGREYDYYVDATTGEVIKNNDFVSGGRDVITEEQALDLAIKDFKLIGRENEIKVHKIKLDRDDYRLVYEVEFYIGNLKYEAEIDAATGAVIEKETSYD